MNAKDILLQFKNGLFDRNPLLVQVLGVCASLAITTTVSNSLYMGLAVTAVLVCSNLLISLLRRFIPEQVRIAAYIVIISGFVTIVEMVMNAYMPSAAAKLGIFLPLIVVNCIILGRAEAFASKNTPLPSIIDGFAMGAGFTIALLLLGAIREILGSGSFFGIQLFGQSYTPIGILTSPPGAFMTLGCLIALIQYLKDRLQSKTKASADQTHKDVKNKEVEPNDL
ncbi:MAG: electron transport complex subunit E [Clostridia bacterium]|nr:electron transport complex subunit E [Clostridia bacterium]